MPAPEPIDFACPRCDRSPLDVGDGGPTCPACDVTFPEIAGVPALFAEPSATLAQWRGRAQFLLQSLSHRAEQLEEAARRNELPESTRSRLMNLSAATTTYRGRLHDLSAPLLDGAEPALRETYLALRTQLPADQGPVTYFANVHRDWCWGDEENSASAELVHALSGGEPLGRVLVLGSGAGRLAYDLHSHTDITVALEFNPLLVRIAQLMTSGETLDLHEFPIAPIDAAHEAVLRRLSSPKPAGPELVHCLADAHRPPFPHRSFDTIVTPWLIDILPEPLEELARRVNTLLRDGGRWINFGSVNFHHADPAECLSPEECLERVGDSGFSSIESGDSKLPYLHSPASRHARTETVLTWSATKVDHVKRVTRHQALPDWIVRGKDPVPLLDHFKTQAATTRIHAFILSLIDGRRSITGMAQQLEQHRLMPREDAEHAIRQFMITLFEESRRGRRYGGAG